MAAVNPARPEADPPGGVMSAAVLLDTIDDRSGAMTHKRDSQDQGTSTATRSVRRNWAAAFAAGFAVVLIVGVAFGLLNRGGDPLDVVTPATTTTPTSVPDATPTTIPDATMTSAPDTAPLVTINADQIIHPLPGDAASGVTVVDESLWASTGAGIVRWDLEGGDPELFTSAEGVPMIEGFAPAITVAPDGTVWAYAFYPQDLVAFDGTRWSEPPGYDQIDILNPRCSPDDECPNPITAMAVGPDGVLFLALGDGTLVEFDGVDWSVHPATVDATDMAVAADGTLWVAGWDEVSAYDGDTWTQFTTADGLPSVGIGTVAVAPNGDVWVGATDSFGGEETGGAARFDGNTWTVFDETDGLYENNVVALTIGTDGTVWVVHSATDDLDSAEEVATGGISRFDGAAWSTTTIADVEIGFGWGGAAADDTGTLWITSRWGVVGFDGTEATVLRFPEGTRSPISVLPSSHQSQILPASEDPFEWRWVPLGGATSEVAGAGGMVTGEGCYGSGGGEDSHQGVEFHAGYIDLTLGYRVTPDVVVTDAGGTITEVGNPFGEFAWLCSVAATDTHILAVGSGVSWSEDGIIWHGIEAFEEMAGWNVDGSNLMWAAAGPGGYLVLGREGVVWFSGDLQTWYEIHLEDGYGLSRWGWVGPSGAAVGDEIVIDMGGEGWVGTRREG